jgi:hypothetical protein
MERSESATEPAAAPPRSVSTPVAQADRARAALPGDPSRATRIAMITGVTGVVVGFVVGYVVAARPASSAATVSTTSAMASSSAAPAPPGGPAELVLDLGADEAQPALHGPWKKTQISQRTVAQTTGPGTSIELSVWPSPNTYGLAAVAKATGIDQAQTLQVALRLNQGDVGVWKIGADWDMHALVVENTKLKPGKNVLELVLPPGASEQGPSIAVDTLHVGPLYSRAEAGMAALDPRGSLVNGYYGKEGEGEQASTWSSGLRTRIGLLLAPLNSEYDLQLEGYAFGPLQPLDVEAVVNSKSVGIAKVDKGPRYVFHAPPGAFKPGLNIVELVYPKTLKPSDGVKGSNDQRDLAIRILRVAAAPAATPMR